MTVANLRARMTELIRVADAAEQFPDKRLITDMLSRLKTGLGKKMLDHTKDPNLTFAEFVQRARAYEEAYEQKRDWQQLNEHRPQREPNRRGRNEPQNYARGTYNSRGAYRQQQHQLPQRQTCGAYEAKTIERTQQSNTAVARPQIGNQPNARTNAFIPDRGRPCRRCGSSHWDKDCPMTNGQTQRIVSAPQHVAEYQSGQMATRHQKYFAVSIEPTTNSIARIDAQIPRPYCALRMNDLDIVQILVDSGADHNVIGAWHLQKLTTINDTWWKAYMSRDKSIRPLYGFDNSRSTTLEVINVIVTVKDRVTRTLTFDIAPICSAGIIIDLPGMKELEFSMYSPLLGWNVFAGKENRLPEHNNIPHNARTYISRTLIPDDKILIAVRRKIVVAPHSEVTIPTMEKVAHEARTSLFTVDYIASDDLPILTDDIRHLPRVTVTNSGNTELVICRGDTLAYATAADTTVYKATTEAGITVNSIEKTENHEPTDDFTIVDCRKRQEKIALLDSLALKEMPMFSQQCRGRVRKLFHAFADVIYYDICDLTEPCAAEPMRIVTDDGPVYSKPRPIEISAWEFECSKIAELKAAGFIEEAEQNSPWQSPVTIVAKRGTDKYRFCIDLRKVNNITTMVAGRIPQLQELVQACKNKCYFSSFDLKQAYHQMEIAKEDRIKTTFACRQGIYQ